MDLHQIAHGADDLAREFGVLAVQHVAQRAEDQRNQRNELDRVIRVQLRQEAADRAARLHLDQRLLVLLQRLVEEGD